MICLVSSYMVYAGTWGLCRLFDCYCQPVLLSQSPQTSSSPCTCMCEYVCACVCMYGCTCIYILVHSFLLLSFVFDEPCLRCLRRFVQTRACAIFDLKSFLDLGPGEQTQGGLADAECQVMSAAVQIMDKKAEASFTYCRSVRPEVNVDGRQLDANRT